MSYYLAGYNGFACPETLDILTNSSAFASALLNAFLAQYLLNRINRQTSEASYGFNSYAALISRNNGLTLAFIYTLNTALCTTLCTTFNKAFSTALNKAFSTALNKTLCTTLNKTFSTALCTTLRPAHHVGGFVHTGIIMKLLLVALVCSPFGRAHFQHIQSFFGFR